MFLLFLLQLTFSISIMHSVNAFRTLPGWTNRHAIRLTNMMSTKDSATHFDYLVIGTLLTKYNMIVN